MNVEEKLILVAMIIASPLVIALIKGSLRGYRLKKAQKDYETSQLMLRLRDMR